MSLAAHYFIASVERKGLAQSLAAPITILPEHENLGGALAQQRCIMDHGEDAARLRQFRDRYLETTAISSRGSRTMT